MDSYLTVLAFIEHTPSLNNNSTDPREDETAWRRDGTLQASNLFQILPTANPLEDLDTTACHPSGDNILSLVATNGHASQLLQTRTELIHKRQRIERENCDGVACGISVATV